MDWEGKQYQFKAYYFAPMLPFPFLHCSLFVIRSYTGEIPGSSHFSVKVVKPKQKVVTDVVASFPTAH